MAWLPWPGARRGALFRLVAFCGCGLGASLAVLLWYGQHPTLSAGPSGALLGLLLVALVQRGTAPRQRTVYVLVALSLLIGGALTGGDTAAHLGGAAAGLTLSLCERADFR